MRRTFSSWWYDLQDSLWLIPAILTALAAALALGMVRLDHAFRLDQRLGSIWLFGGSAEGARGVLAAIAGTMITVTGVVFSITIVALQLASSQFSPRVLRNFTGDRGNQIVLGVFIATFTYALVVLRSVRAGAGEREAFVPAASVTLAIVLALTSIALLIYYIHHAARSIQAAVVIDHAASDTLRLVDERFPSDLGRAAPRPEEASGLPAAPPGIVCTERGGYLQQVDEEALFRLADCGIAAVRIEPEIGEFLLPGMPLAAVWPADGAADSGTEPDRLEKRVRAAFVLGPERTLAEDLALGIRQLTDIAVKALSPGINDPTTATICIDRLGEVLVTLANRERPPEARTGPEGRMRLLARGPAFAPLVREAFAQIRHYGAGDAVVVEHLGRTLGRAAQLVPPARRPPFALEARLLLETAEGQAHVVGDLARVRAACAWAFAEEPGPLSSPSGPEEAG